MILTLNYIVCVLLGMVIGIALAYYTTHRLQQQNERLREVLETVGKCPSVCRICRKRSKQALEKDDE